MRTVVAHQSTSDKPALSRFSLEITAKDVAALREVAPLLPPGTPVSVTFLPGETMNARIAAVRVVRELGFEPVPHISARRIVSEAELADMVDRTTGEAGVTGIFIVAGDPPVPAGPYADTLSIIRTGLLERHGVNRVGIAGHPEGHDHMDEAQRWAAVIEKHREVVARGMRSVIVTQFGFAAEPFLAWLLELRGRGIDSLVRLGVPGPAGIKTLLRFAARCGVGASASVLTKYGISVTKLLGTAGPDKLVGALEAGLTPAHGDVLLHFYPFGGLPGTVGWIRDYQAAHSA